MTYRRWRITSFLAKTVPVGLFLAIITGLMIWHFFQPQYQASAWLRIKGAPDYIAFPPREPLL